MEPVLAGDWGFGGGTESTLIGFGSGGGGLCERFPARLSDRLLRRLLPPKIPCDLFPWLSADCDASRSGLTLGLFLICGLNASFNRLPGDMLCFLELSGGGPDTVAVNPRWPGEEASGVEMLWRREGDAEVAEVAERESSVSSGGDVLINGDDVVKYPA